MVFILLTYLISLDVFRSPLCGSSLIDLVLREAVVLPVRYLLLLLLYFISLALDLLFQQPVNLLESIGTGLITHVKVGRLATLMIRLRHSWSLINEVRHVEESFKKYGISLQSLQALRDHLIGMLRL